MQEIRRIARDAAEDMFFGQVVINWARWFVIGAGVILALGVANDASEFVVGILPVVAFMAINFYLHGRYLAERPANATLIAVASLVDLAAITAVVLLWPESDQRGLSSPFFIMYYPVLLAFAFVMPRKATVAYILVTLAAYAGACLLADTSVFTLSEEVGGGLDVAAVKGLVMRLITLAAVGGLGTYYWRVQRDRRHAATGAPVEGHNLAAGD